MLKINNDKKEILIIEKNQRGDPIYIKKGVTGQFKNFYL